MINLNMFCKLKVVDFLRIVLCLLLARPLETTTNNQEVKRILHRLLNVNNLPQDYIHTCLSCRSLTDLFIIISLIELQEYIYSNLQNISDHI